MIGILLFALVFVCIGSIFFPAWRKLAASLFWTCVVIVGGMVALVAIFAK